MTRRIAGSDADGIDSDSDSDCIAIVSLANALVRVSS